MKIAYLQFQLKIHPSNLNIFHRLPLLKSVVKFQIGFGDPKSLSNSIFFQFSIKIRNLAPESGLGAEHFKHCVILGHPN